MKGVPLAHRKHVSTKVGALLFAAGLPLGLFAASAAADVLELAPVGGDHGGHGGSDINNDNLADAYITQDSWVRTKGAAASNSGFNFTASGVGGHNGTDQSCLAYAADGNISGASHDAHAGNLGGLCDNDATSANNGTSTASIGTGPATANNSATTTVTQNNSGGVTVDQTADATDIHTDKGNINNINTATLMVAQNSGVSTHGYAVANSGGNAAVSGVYGGNWTHQAADSTATNGDITPGEPGAHDLTTGNTGGTAANAASSTNTGVSTASVNTGAATASNSSTTTVSQTNSGGVSGTQSATASDIHS